MRSWDQDDGFEFQGNHVFIPGGNSRLVEALTQGLDIRYSTPATCVRYRGDAGVQVVTPTGILQADAAVVAVPLGVLKRGLLTFDPPLPPRKQQAIQNLGFGVLNKVALLFPEPFWGVDADMLAYVPPSDRPRGEFFLFYSYANLSGSPVLIALVSCRCWWW